jgi:hypothetical protein
MQPTQVQITLFNAILNPYPGARPKNPAKKYNMKKMFEKLAKNHTFPYPVALDTSLERTYVDSIRIDEVYACLPGGRGCVGKERMGKKMLDRQVAVVSHRGVKYNPNYDADSNESYGFLQLVGVVRYKDGKESNISIPVEPSGVIGLRTGASSLARIGARSEKNTLMDMVKEIQTILFRLLGIQAIAEPRFGMINGMFNIYTDKSGKQRPKMDRFVHAVKSIYKVSPMKEYYQKPDMPWMRVQPGVPSVMKAVYRPLTDTNRSRNYRRDENTLPTWTLSPYGHVEIMGGKSVESILDAYHIINDSVKSVSISIIQPNLPTNNTESQKRTYKKRTVNTSVPLRIDLNQTGKILLVNGKPCETIPKPLITQLAQMYGVPSRGTKQNVCDRILRAA